MPRAPRAAIGGMVYHVLNRANARLPLFECDADYAQFEQVLAEAHARVAMRTLAYCVMPNHWHLVLWPRGDADLSEFLRWLTVTHTQRWHASHGTAGTGHIYQGRFKSFPVEARRPTRAARALGTVEAADPLWIVLRYVERNALRAGRVRRAEAWRWCSLWRRLHPEAEPRIPLRAPADGWPADWLEVVNGVEPPEQLAGVRVSVARGRPLGSQPWVRRIAARLHLESTLRPRGRPRKMPNKGS